jgi:hypothetical protein
MCLWLRQRPWRRNFPRRSGNLFVLGLCLPALTACGSGVASEGRAASTSARSSPAVSIPPTTNSDNSDLPISLDRVRTETNQVMQNGGTEIFWSHHEAGTANAACSDVCLLGITDGGVEVQMLATPSHSNLAMLEVQFPVGAGSTSEDGGIEIEALAKLMRGQDGVIKVEGELSSLIQGGQLASTANEFESGPVRYSAQSVQGAGMDGEDGVILFAATATAAIARPGLQVERRHAPQRQTGLSATPPTRRHKGDVFQWSATDCTPESPGRLPRLCERRPPPGP